MPFDPPSQVPNRLRAVFSRLETTGQVSIAQLILVQRAQSLGALRAHKKKANQITDWLVQ
jgi:hypothetical protein